MSHEKTPLHILIVDDSPADRRIYHRFLADFGWEITDASTAKEGLEICAKSTIDCILLDYRMPEVTGLAILPLYKKITSAPIILITGEPDALILAECYRLGASGFLNKDFVSSQTLREAVEKALDI